MSDEENGSEEQAKILGWQRQPIVSFQAMSTTGKLVFWTTSGRLVLKGKLA